MKLSVIVPVYKVEEYLERCLKSITHQTYRDLEIILVDDGSPDRCGEICEEYAQKDERIRVIHKKNGGLSSARNAGIEAANGSYITFVDSDDWIEPTMYEELLYAAEQTDADIAAGAYRYYRPWKTQDNVLEAAEDGQIRVYSNIEALQRLYFGPQMFDGITIMVWNKIYRRELFKTLRFCEGYIHEDRDMTPKLLYYAKRIATVGKTFYNYNIHLSANSTSGMELSVHKINSGVQMSRNAKNFFAVHPVEKVSEYTRQCYYQSLLNGYYECRIRKNVSQEYREKADAYYYEIMSCKEKIKACLRDKKTKLFYISPTVFCFMTRFVRRLKHDRYKLHMLLTGKN